VSEGLKVEVLVEYRDVAKVVRGLPRKDRLEAHPDWWYFQMDYCIRTRKPEDQRSLDPHRPMRRCLKI